MLGTVRTPRVASACDRHNDLSTLVCAAAAGDAAAWDALVARFSRRLTWVVRSHRVPAHAVDDIVQVTFIRLYQHLGRLRDPQALPAWLETTAHRETLKAIKRMVRERPLEVSLLEELPAPREAEEGIDAALRAALDAAIARLPARQGSLLRALTTEEEPSYEQIATRLGIPVGSIGPTRGRALERLREDRSFTAAVRAAACDEVDQGGEQTHLPHWAGPATAVIE
jgi:RNA polymerase sigma factor (sigma-70 family)